MDEMLILVDKDDNEIGREEKVKCHLGEGLLHRAFTAIVMNEKGQILLGKRAPGKMLWEGFWDGTVASHPREGENYVQAAERRMVDELGIDIQMKYLFKFHYHIPFEDKGSEREICAVLIGTTDKDVQPNTEEISEAKYVDVEFLKKDIKENKDIYCPWFIIAFEKIIDEMPKEIGLQA